MTIYEKANRGDYQSKLPYKTARKDRAAYEAYMEDEARLKKQFRDDLEAEFGMKDHPKADKVFAKAWEDGHANGYNEVAACYEGLIDLVK